jgi:hypothetical protein
LLGYRFLTGANGLAGKQCLLRGSAPMTAHAAMDTATEEQCFLCGPCLDVISSVISEYSAVECSEVERVGR